MIRVIVALCVAVFASSALAADPRKVLRVASRDIETLDPQQYTEVPSFELIRALFEGLYEFEYLDVPPRLHPNTADGAPQISDDGRTWVVRVKPGIYFIDDPAFKGKRRELVAEDYVYTIKRWLDPNLRRGGAPIQTDLIIGAREVVNAATKAGKLDYDRPMEGLRATDRYTLQIKLNEASYPPFLFLLTLGAVAREVVEAAGGDIRQRPVGTGPYRLKEWKRGSRILLEANPDYRTVTFPDTRDPAKAELVRSMKGKTLPQIGAVDIKIIDEDVTRLLEFDSGGLDYIVLNGDIASRPLANGKLKPEYAAQGVKRVVFPEAYTFGLYFNMSDPVIGGMTNDKVALRRAIALAIDSAAIVDVVYAGQALPASQIVPPFASGYDQELPVKSLYDPAAAKALLDRFGYDKRDAYGFRKALDGTPLTITFTLRSGAVSREIQTLVKKNLDALGIRLDFHVTPFQDAVKELIAGKYQMYFGGFGGNPSGYGTLSQLWSKMPQSINMTRFGTPDYDRAFEQFLRSPNEPEQLATSRKMAEIARAYVPIQPLIYRLENDYVQPWLQGFAPMPFDIYWKYLDIDLARRASARAIAPKK
jgi:ABC-type transport system substrate-binding protein